MKVVFVIGMHRSGTSTVTAIIHRLGVRIGRPDDLLGVGPGNLRGFWESVRLTEVNDTLLSAAGGSWTSPPAPRDLARMSLAQRARSRIAFARVYGWSRKPLLWKDPRNSLLLGCWQRILNADPVIVLVFRQPEEVARSLHRRDGMELAEARQLWRMYNQRALEVSVGLPTAVVSYAEVVGETVATVAFLRRFLGDQEVLLGSGATEDAIQSAAAAVEPALHHNRVLQTGDAATTPEDVGSLYERLVSLRGAHNPLPPEAPRGWCGRADDESPDVQLSRRKHA